MCTLYGRRIGKKYLRKFKSNCFGLFLSFALVLANYFVVAIADAQVTGTQIDWTYASTNESLASKSLALGNYGTVAASGLGVFNHTFKLFSSFDPNQIPTPFISNTHVGGDTFTKRVATAQKGELAGIFYDVRNVSNPLLRDLKLEIYSTRNANPLFSTTFPFTTNGITNLFLQISADGNKIAAIADNIWDGKTHVKIYSPTSAIPLGQYSYTMNGSNMGAVLSDDGQLLFLRSGLKILIINTASGAVVHSQLIFDTLYYSAFSGDGTRFAYSTYVGSGTAIVKFYKSNPVNGTYELEFTRSYLGLAPITNPHIAYSADSKTVVYALNSTGSSSNSYYKVYALDLSSQVPGALLWEDTNAGANGTLINFASTIALSENGKVIAVGGSGDGSSSGAVDELRIYGRDSNVPIAAFNFSGSVQELMISPDGRTLLVGRKSTHEQILASGCSIHLINIGERQLRILGVPHANSTVTLQFNMGYPNITALLLQNSFWANPPAVFPLMGTLYPGRVGLSSSILGDTNSSGMVVTSLQVPGISAQSKVLQGAKAGQRRLTERGIQLSPVP